MNSASAGRGDLDPTLDGPTVARLQNIPTAVIASLLLARGYRSISTSSLPPLATGRRMVGEAVTLRCAPAREDVVAASVLTSPDYPQRAAIESCTRHQVLVVEGRGVTSAGIGGEVYLTRLRQRGASGCVVDGSVRDAAALGRLGLPVHARGTSATPHHARHVAVAWNVPVGIDGVLVLPGDVVVGDEDGIVVIPRSELHAVLESAASTMELESFAVARLGSGEELDGLFPLSSERLQEFQTWRDTGTSSAKETT